MTTNKRDRSMFEAVHRLNEEDALARTKLKAATRRQEAARKATLSQQKIYGQLLQVRILLQRALQGQQQGEDDNPDSTESKDDAIAQCNRLLTQLLTVQAKLQSPSDNTDDSNTDFAELVESGNPEALEAVIERSFVSNSQNWESVLNKRHKDLRLHSGLTQKAQFRIVDSDFWSQVQSTVTHEEMRRNTDPNAKYDDSKIYQQLLKEFLSGNAGSTDAQSSDAAHNQAQQRLRAPRKTNNKQVDRRASKGRKLRYTPIPKLANFTFPLSREVPALDEDAWFKSLFGGSANLRKKAKVSEEDH